MGWRCVGVGDRMEVCVWSVVGDGVEVCMWGWVGAGGGREVCGWGWGGMEVCLRVNGCVPFLLCADVAVSISPQC